MNADDCAEKQLRLGHGSYLSPSDDVVVQHEACGHSSGQALSESHRSGGTTYLWRQYCPDLTGSSMKVRHLPLGASWAIRRCGTRARTGYWYGVYVSG